jgi:hypothetical protein
MTDHTTTERQDQVDALPDIKDERDVTEHVEKTDIEAAAEAVKASNVHETAYVGLSKLQALRKFWRASLFCYICAFGVMMDGYQNAFPGKWTLHL